MTKHRWTKPCRYLSIILLTGLLCSCAKEYRPDLYDFNQLGQAQQIYTVQILAVMPITVKNDTGMAGDGAVGAASGAVLGNLIGGNSKGTGIGALAGGFIGGLIGATHKEKGILIKYKDHDGSIKSMTQMGLAKDYQLGSATETIFYDQQGNQQIRIMPNNVTDKSNK